MARILVAVQWLYIISLEHIRYKRASFKSFNLASGFCSRIAAHHKYINDENEIYYCILIRLFDPRKRVCNLDRLTV